jgi:hypothetical protein
LAIVVSASLIVAGPFRAAWNQPSKQGKAAFKTLLPMIISFTYLLAVMTILAQIAHPFVNLWASSPDQPGDIQVLAVTGMIVQTTILMGLVLLAIRRWTLPFGTFTVVFTVNIALLSLMHNDYWITIVAFLGGLAADILLWQLKPSVQRPGALRIFAFAVPTILYLLYFLELVLTTGVHWTIHLWLGSTVVAGLTGWLLSYLLVPPALPFDETR